MTTVKLHFIRAYDANGDSQDLLVRSRDATDAIAMWRAYYGDYAAEEIEWIGVVPDAPAQGAIRWDTIRRT